MTTEDPLTAPGGSGSSVVPGERPWWTDAVFYQIYPRSYACAGSSQGVGDLRGIIDRLDHVVGLGVDAVWLSPVFCSPQVDHGYDVSDYYAIDPIFGTMADFDELLQAAHDRGLRVLLDMVPNHTSDQHAWFTAAVAAGRGARERDWYLFRDGRGADGAVPPTDVLGSFTQTPVWTRVTEPDGTPGQWYFHLFTAEQPDLNWLNPAVLAAFEQIWRFWLDKGVDGFRVDVADHLTKDVDRNDVRFGNDLLTHDADNRTHEVLRALRSTLRGYEHQPTAIGEIWSGGASYSSDDEFPQTFGFPILKAGWDAPALRAAIQEVLADTEPVWVIDNHDTPRSASRLGPARSRALTLLMLGLPGAACLYQGQELGLPNVDDLPDEVLADPVWQRSGGTDRGRDGCRVPLPWSGSQPPFGFCDDEVEPWLPQPPQFAGFTVESQRRDPTSTLELTRRWLGVRKQLVGAGFQWRDEAPDRVHFQRPTDTGTIDVLMNLGDTSIALPPGRILAHSDPKPPDGWLPPDAAVWWEV
ncbi:MAG: alpha-amylase [Micrococcales bacterium]|nr:alpha-amylase [Micrococcales bacterium]